MIEFKIITDYKDVSILFNHKIIGHVYNHYELYDILIQIMNQNVSGYSILYDGNEHEITSSGRIKIDGGDIPYKLFDDQLDKLLGF
jgi:hypothetical protein